MCKKIQIPIHVYTIIAPTCNMYSAIFPLSNNLREYQDKKYKSPYLYTITTPKFLSWHTSTAHYIHKLLANLPPALFIIENKYLL